MPEIIRDSAARTPPHNLEAEKSVLGAIFIKPSAFDEVGTNLEVDDFFLPVHREIFEAMLAIDKRRQALDHVAVADELKTRGMLGRLDGGESHLIALANAVPTAENAVHYARIVREKATLRRLIAACAEVQSTAYGDFGDAETFINESKTKIERATARAAITSVQTLAELVRGLKPVPRLATQFATLNAATRGGLPLRSLTIIGGQPGAGKTTMALGIGLYLAAGGAAVTYIAADEALEDILIRVSQAEGFDRRLVEDADPSTLAAVADRLMEAYPGLQLLDGEKVTIEEAAGTLRKRANGRPAVLIGDSLQTLRVRGVDEWTDGRTRIDAAVRAFKRAAGSGIAGLATSEVARGFYRTKNPADRTEAIASFKESSGIEYGAKLALVLRSVDDDLGLVDVQIAKNRFGKKLAFRLKLDPALVTFTEIVAPAADAPTTGDRTAPISADILRARTELANSPGVAGKFAWSALLTGMGRTRAWDAIQALEQAGEVENRGTKSRPKLYLANPTIPAIPAIRDTAASSTIPAIPVPYRGIADQDSSSGGDDDGEARDSGREDDV